MGENTALRDLAILTSEMFAENEGRGAWMWEGTREQYAKEMTPNG